VTELLSTTCLLVLLVLQVVLERIGVEGSPSFNSFNHDQRVQGIYNYLVILVAQVIGICFRYEQSL
jgi:hypothetical protein